MAGADRARCLPAQAADQCEARESEREQDDEEDEGAVFQAPTELALDAIEDPVGGEVQGDGDQGEVDGFHAQPRGGAGWVRGSPCSAHRTTLNSANAPA